MANALLMAEHRGVISEAKTFEFHEKLYQLPIKTFDKPINQAPAALMALAREHQLTAYDAAYLTLALQENATLATFDRKLARAIENAGGELFS